MRYEKKMSVFRRKALRLIANFKGITQKAHTISKIKFGDIIATYGDNRSDFPIDLAIVAIIKNEAPYVKEWIEYHKLVGVKKFYLFDNESTDDLKQVLKPYIQKKVVDYHFIKGKGKQLDAYRKAIEIAKENVKWLAIIDLDEFILPVCNKTIVQILDEKKRSAMLVGWMIYGSSGYRKKQHGLVTEVFKKHATDDFIADYKSIVNPRKVLRVVNPHYCIVAGKTTDESGKVIYQYPYINRPETVAAPKNRIRINHYYSKSWEEFESKSLRGYADISSKERNSRNIADFNEHDQNKVEDHYIDKYVSSLKKLLQP